ncbi:integrator complex assembly factor BRAT1 [Brachyhypopomus gauderio]|uniref:integrator complex assembly factor BRAT1 n=1 Tax=Brachyhypopomus gauderio TaxID=698409 RepID=UPI00404130E2
MDSACVSLLPSVCEALADPKLVPPDDTSLEKLLDWFNHLTSQADGQSLLQHQPCLLRFLYSVMESDAMDPTIFSFSLKLAGLLAAGEQDFCLLQEEDVLVRVFVPDGWHTPGLWSEASVRCGWIQGLRSMIQNPQAMDFFCRNGIITLVLQLQNDESLFIASLTNQILADILNSSMSPVLSSGTDGTAEGGSPVRPDWASVTTQVMRHMSRSLASEDQTVILPGLRLLTVALTRCSDPLKGTLWNHVQEHLETLANGKRDSLTQPIMAVLQAAARTPLLLQPERGVEALMNVMLCSRNTDDSVRCAVSVLQLEHCPEVLKNRATDIVLLPLLYITGTRQWLPETDETSGHHLLMDQLSHRASCVSLLSQSLSSIGELICKNSLSSASIGPVSSSVVSLLNMCIGHHPSTVLQVGTFPHLIGCCKVQRCGLEVLGSLTVYKESVGVMDEAFTILLRYLQSPDSHATVLKKTHQAALKWFSACSPSPDVWRIVSNDLFSVLKKHVCDGRWAVRDSTLEFIAQLTAALKGYREYAEALHAHGIISVLFTALSDVEAYVQASAVFALGEALTTAHLPLCASLQEEVVARLLTVLDHDAESFPRRAALKVFTSWLKIPQSLSVLDQSLSSVFSLGGNDCDWEVKVHTLELADVLLEKLLSRCPYAVCGYDPSQRCAEQTLTKLMNLGLLELLFKCLFDCDRPVAQKACAQLLKLRTFLSETSGTDTNDLALEIHRCSWGEEIVHRYRVKYSEQSDCVNNNEASQEQADVVECDRSCPKELGLFEILDLLDLDEMQQTLSLSSDHVINSPQSLMEDILFVAQQSEDNVVDCY